MHSNLFSNFSGEDDVLLHYSDVIWALFCSPEALVRKGAELFREVMKSYTLYWKVLDLNILKWIIWGFACFTKWFSSNLESFFFPSRLVRKIGWLLVHTVKCTQYKQLYFTRELMTLSVCNKNYSRRYIYIGMTSCWVVNQFSKSWLCASKNTSLVVNSLIFVGLEVQHMLQWEHGPKAQPM